MLIKTKFLGEVEIKEEELIVFLDGIPGFEESRRFILLDIPENDFFKVLQDVDQEFISFIVAEPWKFMQDYEIDVPDEELLKINIRSKKQIALLNIITLYDAFEMSTINLLAPVIMNKEHKIGRQYVLNNVRYSTKYPLFKKEDGTHADPK